MPEAATSLLSAWENFYVIIGSSAGALTGLMFVVVTLSAEARAKHSDVSAFGTPTVVHFSNALLVSAIGSAPWPGLAYAAAAFGLVGLAGVSYVGIVIRRARRTTGYRPVLEDWIFHAGLPLAAYGLLVASSARLPAAAPHALFGIAAAAVLLLFVAIHNAWDTVTFIALERLPQQRSGN